MCRLQTIEDPEGYPLKAPLDLHLQQDCSAPHKLARKVRLCIYKEQKTTDCGTLDVHVTFKLESLWDAIREFALFGWLHRRHQGRYLQRLRAGVAPCSILDLCLCAMFFSAASSGAVGFFLCFIASRRASSPSALMSRSSALHFLGYFIGFIAFTGPAPL